MANQKFDFERANALKNTLQNDIGVIEGNLKKMTSHVQSVNEWWTGGSEQAFISNFESTKNQVQTSLNKWIEDYKQLIQQIADIKRDSDAELASKLRV